MITAEREQQESSSRRQGQTAVDKGGERGGEANLFHVVRSCMTAMHRSILLEMQPLEKALPSRSRQVGEVRLHGASKLRAMCSCS